MSPRSDTAVALLALRCLDLTSLKDDDSDTSIETLAARARTPHGAPAALCVYPRFIGAARRALQAAGLPQVRLATVVNFPRGEASPSDVAREIDAAVAAGADEIDVVFPWRALLAGDAAAGSRLVAASRRACDAADRTVLLKVILESGELREPHRIVEAGRIAVEQGADFLKTSTGKVAVNATPEAVGAMLQVIREHGGQVGLKVAGGLTGLAEVKTYLALAAEVCGEAWLTPRRLRFGASGLLGVLVSVLDGDAPAAGTPASY
ncbi:deoxyribose-phosphate aldolase [Aquabacterium sp. A7-Y]|uniref:deoxyribose-phosphate aldolase n=1 Tax=Aquabacterium sp. A7-Y TaxID=1349605 RepID=UPI00223E73E8|nr:deoxyribose-phosphate aldolase [Aquabacterium sp. A7-Y]MCW7542053.1 deoxyribose-phosphate aldolase [Aquabacterium sp. A7-Y]